MLAVGEIQKVLQNLLREKVSIRNLEAILEVLADSGRQTKDAEQLTETVRQRVGTVICQALANKAGELYVLTLDPSIEHTLATSIRAIDNKTTLVLEPRFAEQVLARIATHVETMMKSNLMPVLLCAPELRRHLRRITERVLPHLSVVSMAEVPNSVNLKAFGVGEPVKIGAAFIPLPLRAAGGESLVLPGRCPAARQAHAGPDHQGQGAAKLRGPALPDELRGTGTHRRQRGAAADRGHRPWPRGRPGGAHRVAARRCPAGRYAAARTVARSRSSHARVPRISRCSFVAQLFDRHQARLATEDARALQRLASRAALPDLMALSGLILSKLNLRMAPEFLKAVYGALERGGRGGVFALSGTVPEIELASSRSAEAAGSRAPFAALLAGMLMEVPESRWRHDAGPGAKPDDSAPGTRPDGPQGTGGGLASGSGRAGGGEGFDLARWILNAQNGGAVAHRVGTLPLLIGGRLVELDVAVFEEPAGEDGQETSHIRHRRVVVAMDTETLGRIEASALFAADRIRVTLSTSSSESTGALARHMGPLTAELERSGWHVDEMKYETRAPVGPGGVMTSVVEHLVSPGSVSTLA